LSAAAIDVQQLSKRYRLGQVGAASFAADARRWLQGRFGSVGPRGDVGEIWALRDVNFVVAPGEVVGLVGRNGAGKSTLLKLLTRITAPTTGVIRIKGRISSLLEVGTGFHPELTGRENVFLNGAILGMTKGEIAGKIDQIVAFAEIDRYLDTPVKRYSSGMYVRLAFAVAAHLESEIIAVDEVLAVGDAAFQQKCLGAMSGTAASGRTVLFVSHNMAAVRRLCDRVLMFDSGRLVHAGPADVVCDIYEASLLNSAQGTHDGSPGVLYRRDSLPVTGCSITAIHALDLDGRPLALLRTWDPLRLRIHYVGVEAVNQAAIEFHVHGPDGAVLTLCSTRPDSTCDITIEESERWVDCVFPNWPFAAGTYRLSAGITRPGFHYLSWSENICRLVVGEKDVYQSGLAPSSPRYLVAPDYRWERSSPVGGESTNP
jgi:lipopolysaccharide transport system ATP-binding protein